MIFFFWGGSQVRILARDGELNLTMTNPTTEATWEEEPNGTSSQLKSGYKPQGCIAGLCQVWRHIPMSNVGQ